MTAQRILNGAAILDEAAAKKQLPKNWRKKINLETLAMGSYDDCLLGQLFGDFGIGVMRLKFNLKLRINFWACGFVVNESLKHVDRAYTRLTEGWKAYLS